MTLKLTFTVPQAAADQLADGLGVLHNLVFDRSASPHSNPKMERNDPAMPILCGLYVDDVANARHAKALIEVIADLVGFEMPVIRQQRIEEQDWITLTQKNLPPVCEGRFHIRGGHCPAPTDGSIDLCIEAGLAFGTGHHETTRGCLRFFDRMLRLNLVPKRALDMGCGSGVLAMAVAKSCDANVVGIERDPDSLNVARENLIINELSGRVTYILGETPDLDGSTFDLIFANILAGPLIEMAPALTKVAEPGANLLLAGLFVEQEKDILYEYNSFGWNSFEGCHDNQWSIQWFKR